MLALDRNEGESVIITIDGKKLVIKVMMLSTYPSGKQKVRLSFDGPMDFKIMRDDATKQYR